MTYIGIDVSKDSFVAAYPSKSGYTTKTFKNIANGVRQFINSLPEDCHCVMEATGNYSMLLLYLLQKANITVSMENPQKIKHFARAMLSTTKTDEIDAKLIAMYGEKMEPEPYRKFRQRVSFCLSRNVLSFVNSRSNSLCGLTSKSQWNRYQRKIRPVKSLLSKLLSFLASKSLS